MNSKFILKLVAIFTIFLSLNCASHTNCIGLEKTKESLINITHKHNKTLLPYDSFVKLEKKFFDKQQNYLFSSFASGVIVKHFKNSTAILTAKHFCDNVDEEKRLPKDQLPLFGIIGVYNKEQNVYFSVAEKLDKIFDLCIIYTDSKIEQEALILSPIKPERSEKVFNISGPLGLSNGNTVLVFEGYYAGLLVSSVSEYTALYSIPAASGSSGSGILNEHGELIGILYAVMKEFNHVALVVPYDEVKRFLGENNLLN